MSEASDGFRTPRIVLASGSPRRREMLEAQDLEFEIRVAEVDETPWAREDADAYVLRLAVDKAVAVAGTLDDLEDVLVIAADTVVEVDGELLGKPTSKQDAQRMVSSLAGRDHRVCTGVAVKTRSHGAAGVESSRVRFGAMSTEDVAWYVDTDEPMDKAGGYAVQGLAAPFIDSIEGCYHNIVGLPLARLRRLLVEIGIRWRDLPRRAR